MAEFHHEHLRFNDTSISDQIKQLNSHTSPFPTPDKIIESNFAFDDYIPTAQPPNNIDNDNLNYPFIDSDHSDNNNDFESSDDTHDNPETPSPPESLNDSPISRPQSVRIGKCQNRKVSELESVMIC